MFNLIKKLREQAEKNLLSINKYDNILDIVNKERIYNNFELIKKQTEVNKNTNNISRQVAYNQDLTVENRRDLLKRVQKDITNSTLSAGYITICDNMIHGYYGGRQHEGLKGGKFIFDMDNLSKINNICINTNKATKEINDKYENSFPTSRLKESFLILAKTYIDLSKVSPRYEFVSESCIQKVASSLRLDFSRDSLYEFDFLKAVEDSKILYDETVKELADTMFHRHLLGGTLDTVKNPSEIKRYNDLYKDDPILGIKKVIEDRDIKIFKNPETVKEQKDAIEKEPERLKSLMEEMENTIDSPKPT